MYIFIVFFSVFQFCVSDSVLENIMQVVPIKRRKQEIHSGDTHQDDS